MSSIQRVQSALHAHLPECSIQLLDDSAHTAADAANALGCEVAQIVKSLIFKTAQTHQPVLALISGDKRLDLDKLSHVIEQPLEKADAQFVKSVTGFSIGGVAPLGSLTPLPVYMDDSLLMHDKVWAAGGHPKAIFAVDPHTLLTITQAQALSLTV